jgi:hypothetical protein
LDRSVERVLLVLVDVVLRDHRRGREGIFSRSLPLATRDLRIVPSRLGDRAGAIGAATMVIEHVLSPDAVDRALEAAA